VIEARKKDATVMNITESIDMEDYAHKRQGQTHVYIQKMKGKAPCIYPKGGTPSPRKKTGQDDNT
jgi:hypothetical protein